MKILYDSCRKSKWMPPKMQWAYKTNRKNEVNDDVKFVQSILFIGNNVQINQVYGLINRLIFNNAII